jgi:hypothetical protein
MPIVTQPLSAPYTSNTQLPALLEQLERYVAFVYDDGAGPDPKDPTNRPGHYATIGIGFNIWGNTDALRLVLDYLDVFRADDLREETLRVQQGFPPRTAAQIRARHDSIVADFHKLIESHDLNGNPQRPGESTSEQALQSALNAKLVTYGVSRAFQFQSATDARTAKMRLIQGFTIGGYTYRGFESGLDALLPKHPVSGAPLIAHDTREYMALMSLYFNNSDLVGPRLRTALAIADPYEARAEAWYQIRYVHRAELPGLAKRRFVEAAIFGLYGSNVPAADALKQARAIYAMYTLHGRNATPSTFDMVAYDATFAGQLPTAQGDLDAVFGAGNVLARSLREELRAARDVLVAQYITAGGITGAPTIDPLNIQVANSLAVLRGEDTATRTGSNSDLLIAKDGLSAMMRGLGGNDVLIGLTICTATRATTSSSAAPGPTGSREAPRTTPSTAAWTTTPSKAEPAPTATASKPASAETSSKTPTAWARSPWQASPAH